MKIKWKIISALGLSLIVGSSFYALYPGEKKASTFNDSSTVSGLKDYKVVSTANKPSLDDQKNPKSFWLPNAAPTEKSPLDGWVNEEATEPSNKELSSFIASSHETFNALLEYDRYLEFDWAKFDDTAESMLEDIERISPSLQSPDIKLDAARLHDLITIAVDKQDIDALLYSHRILQDLDVEYNKREDSKFGFSLYHKGGENQMIVTKYLEENKSL